METLIILEIAIDINRPITQASKIFTQIFSLVRWCDPPMLLTGGF